MWMDFNFLFLLFTEVVDEHEEDKRASFNDMLSRSLRSSVSDYQQRPNTNHAIEMWTRSLRSHPTDMFTRALRYNSYYQGHN